MWFPSVLQRWRSGWPPVRPNGRPARRKPASPPFTVEALEDRTVPSFLASVSYGTGGYPTDVAVGDFNKDGVPDMAVVNAMDNNVSVRLGNGDGTFGGAKTFATGKGPWSIGAGDFNNDGRLDIVTTSASGVSTLLGNGDGTFQPPKSVSVGKGQNVNQLAVGDLNGDGTVDLAVTGTKFVSGGPGPGGGLHSFSEDGYLSVLLGKGDGSFRITASLLFSNAGPSSIALADFSSDGKLDVVVYVPGVYLLLGNGDGTLGSPTRIAGVYGSLAVGDLNGDGRFDLVGRGRDAAVTVALGNGDGTFQPAQSFAADPASVGTNSDPMAHAVTLADINHDGKLDIVTSNRFSGTVSVLLGNGDGTFGSAQTLAVSGPGALAVADLNGDGWLDLVVANVDSNTVAVLLNDGHW
jgi:hypothetical protein